MSKTRLPWLDQVSWRLFGLGVGLAAIALAVISRPWLVNSPPEMDVLNPPHRVMAQEQEPDVLMAQALLEKQSMASRIQAAQSIGRQNPAPRQANLLPDMPAAKDPPLRTGILEGESGPFHAAEVLVVNVWQDLIDEGLVQVFAGALGGDSNQGLVIVIRTSSDRSTATESWHRTPVPAGAVRIESVEGGRLRLISSDGTPFLFDLEAEQFLTP